MIPKLSGLYYKIYDFISGRDPRQRLWHFRFLAVYYLHKDLKKFGSKYLRGNLLDVGCGDKPYEKWFPDVKKYTGIDVYRANKVDYIFDGYKIPLKDNEFDSLLCTQVIEHVDNYENILGESYRCLKDGAYAVFSLPFIYNEHGYPGDFWRVTRSGARQIVEKAGFKVKDVVSQGGAGSTVIVLILNFIDEMLSRNKIVRFTIKPVFTPFFIFISCLLNIIGLLIDKIDSTGLFYNNVLIIAEKVEQRP